MTVARKLFIRTFGCQMNEYDSDRMADVLAREGLALTDRPDDADVILFNTCSVREKAQERVFHDLGRVRALKADRPDLLIGGPPCTPFSKSGFWLEWKRAANYLLFRLSRRAQLRQAMRSLPRSPSAPSRPTSSRRR